MGSVPLVRCLPKMSPSLSTSTGSQIATWRRSLAWTRHDSTPISDYRQRERCSSDHRRFFLNLARHDILPHRQSQLSDLTIRLHITTLNILRRIEGLASQGELYIHLPFQIHRSKAWWMFCLYIVYKRGGKLHPRYSEPDLGGVRWRSRIRPKFLSILQGYLQVV